MKLTINGEVREFQEVKTLKDLLLELKLEEKVMASAINMEVVKKEFWSEQTLKDGDKVELLHFVGGG